MANLIQNLLIKPRWNISDIKLYFNVGTTKASEISQKAKARHPKDGFATARRDDVLKVTNVDLDRELLIIKLVNMDNYKNTNKGEEKNYVS